MNRPRIIFDTSTLVSAAMIAGSIPFRALSRAFDFYEICVSEATLAELADVLFRSKFDSRITRAARLDFLSTYSIQASTFQVNEEMASSVSPGCRDEKDNKFLLLAAKTTPAVIVSSDKDLLVLHPWNGISILTPADFLIQFQAQVSNR